MSAPTHRKRQQAGIATVEFTLVLPLVLFLILATAEVGRAFVQYNVLTRAVRDSARYVANQGIRGASGVLNLDAQLVAQARNLAVYGNTAGGGQPMLEGLATGQVVVTNLGGNNFSVVANYPYTPMIAPALPGLLGNTISTSFTMSAAVAMRSF